MKWLQLHVGGQKWSVHLVKPHVKALEGAAGITYPERCQIYISSALDPAARDDTLLHELLHAALYVSGGCNVFAASCKSGQADNAEEQVVLGLAPMLHRVLKDLGFRFPKGPTE